MRERSCPRPQNERSRFFEGTQMSQNIDDYLNAAFTPDNVIRAFFEYKYAKWDHFSEIHSPKINIPIGADGITYEGFENQLTRNARNICRRINSNSYIFYPFREVEKEKEPKTKPPKYRILSVVSIRDALVQNILYADVLYKPMEDLFRTLDQPRPVSFSYRKGKSAPDAAKIVHEYLLEGYTHYLDGDLSKYFDTIPHNKLLDRLALVIGDRNTITFNLVRRFLKTDRVEFSTYKNKRSKNHKPIGYRVFHWIKPKRKCRKAGVPQGGVLSGMLANLFLHDFDNWVVHDLGQRIDLKYVRYADDFLILVRSPEQLPSIKQEVMGQLKNLGLVMNEREKQNQRPIARKY